MADEEIQVSISSGEAVKQLEILNKAVNALSEEFKKANEPVEEYTKKQDTLGQTIAKNLPFLKGIPFLQVTSGFMAISEAVNLATSAFSGLISKSREYINAAVKQETANAKLRAVIKATGEAAGFSSEQLEGYADILQQTSIFADERYTEAMSRVATFTNIAGDEFIRASKLSADLAATLGSSVPQAALQLGRALNDTRYGLNLLAQSGINLTEEQKELVRVLERSGHEMEAQQMILTILEGKLGGVSEEIRDSGVGAWIALGNQINDVKQEFGNVIAEGIEPATEAISEQFRLLEANIKGGALDGLKDTLVELTNALIDYAEAWKGVKREVDRFIREHGQRQTGVGMAGPSYGAPGISGYAPRDTDAVRMERMEKEGIAFVENLREQNDKAAEERTAKQTKANEELAAQELAKEEANEKFLESLKEVTKELNKQDTINDNLTKSRLALAESIRKEIDPLRETRQEIEEIGKLFRNRYLNLDEVTEVLNKRITDLQEENKEKLDEVTDRGFTASIEDPLTMNRRMLEAAASREDNTHRLMDKIANEAKIQRERQITVLEEARDAFIEGRGLP